MSIVLKARKRSFYGAGRNMSTVGSIATGDMNGSAESFVDVDREEVDRVEVMVEGVKKRGVSFFPCNILASTLVTDPRSRIYRARTF